MIFEYSLTDCFYLFFFAFFIYLDLNSNGYVLGYHTRRYTSLRRRELVNDPFENKTFSWAELRHVDPTPFRFSHRELREPSTSYGSSVAARLLDVTASFNCLLTESVRSWPPRQTKVEKTWTSGRVPHRQTTCRARVSFVRNGMIVCQTPWSTWSSHAW